MWDAVTVITRPAEMPVTLSTAKKWLRVDHADDDDVITLALASAVAAIDGPNGIGVAMMAQTWRRTLSGFCERIALPGWPVKSVTSITYLDAGGTRQTVSSSDYVVELGGNLATVFPAWGMSWPAARVVPGSIQIDYVVGEADSADVPPSLVSAALMLMSHRYEVREAVGPVGMAEIPLGVRSILDEYRRLYVS